MKRTAQDQHQNSPGAKWARLVRRATRASLDRYPRTHACTEIAPAAVHFDTCGSINQRGMTGTDRGIVVPQSCNTPSLNLVESL